LGNTHLEFNLETHFPLSFNEGKMSIKWISDPYSLSVKGKLDKNGVQAKLKTCNASSMTTDLQNYALRLKNADPSLTHIIQPFILYLQVSKKLLEKVLEPAGATRQSVDFEFSDKGVRVGKYNGEEIVKIFGETLAQNNEIPDNDQKLEEIS
jgi:hypothetical protein